ncbi:MAG: ABC transporter permease, partial [Deltaproteobacteria bacterium]|nr:ABC transporter permease [Deltaproteobacteria bacterium]
MKGILTLAIKDLRLLWRDRFGLFWVLGFPLIMALLFGSLYSGSGGAKNIAVAVIDEDATEKSKTYLGNLQKSDALEVSLLDLPTARDKVRQGELTAYIRIEKGFGEQLWGSGENGLPLEVGVDPSKTASRAFLQGILMQTWFESMKDVFLNPKEMQKIVKNELKEIDNSKDMSDEQRGIFKTFMISLDKFMEDVDPDTYSQGEPLGNMQIKTVSVVRDKAHPHSPFDITFPSGILWGLIGCATAFGISIVVE